MRQQGCTTRQIDFEAWTQASLVPIRPGEHGKLVTRFLDVENKRKIKVCMVCAWIVCEIVLIPKHVRDDFIDKFCSLTAYLFNQILGSGEE